MVVMRMPMDNPAMPILRDISGVMEQQKRNIAVLQDIDGVLDQAVHFLIVVASADENNIPVQLL